MNLGSINKILKQSYLIFTQPSSDLTVQYEPIKLILGVLSSVILMIQEKHQARFSLNVLKLFFDKAELEDAKDNSNPINIFDKEV